MPYFLHRANSEPASGTCYDEKKDAVAHRRTGDTITYLSNPSERDAWQTRELRRFRDKTYTSLPWMYSDQSFVLKYYDYETSGGNCNLPTPFREYSEAERLNRWTATG